MEGSALVLLLLGARARQDTVERFVKKVSIILYIRVMGGLRFVAENGTCTYTNIMTRALKSH